MLKRYSIDLFPHEDNTLIPKYEGDDYYFLNPNDARRAYNKLRKTVNLDLYEVQLYSQNLQDDPGDCWDSYVGSRTFANYARYKTKRERRLDRLQERVYKIPEKKIGTRRVPRLKDLKDIYKIFRKQFCLIGGSTKNFKRPFDEKEFNMSEVLRHAWNCTDKLKYIGYFENDLKHIIKHNLLK